MAGTQGPRSVVNLFNIAIENMPKVVSEIYNGKNFDNPILCENEGFIHFQQIGGNEAHYYIVSGFLIDNENYKYSTGTIFGYAGIFLIVENDGDIELYVLEITQKNKIILKKRNKDIINTIKQGMSKISLIEYVTAHPIKILKYINEDADEPEYKFTKKDVKEAKLMYRPLNPERDDLNKFLNSSNEDNDDEYYYDD